MCASLIGQRHELVAALTVRPIAAVLLDAGFQPARGTPIGDKAPDALAWFGEHAGQKLTILAGADWFGQWKLVGTMNTRREAMWDERQLLDDWPQGAVLAVLVKLWRSAFREAPCPDGFQLGAVYEAWLAARKTLNPGLPQLRADGPMLRVIVNRLRAAQEDGAVSQDAWLRIAQISQQMLLRAEGLEWMCPAAGCWTGMAEVKLAEFLRAVPGRFSRQTAELACDGVLLTLAGVGVRARWVS
jgi:hypothetical protein